jgi:hypothetical protein
MSLDQRHNANAAVPLEGSALPRHWSFADVEERLIEAYGFLQRMPDPDARHLRVKTMSIWQQVSITAGMNQVEIAEYRLYRAGDPPRMPGLLVSEVGRMEEALGWLMWLKPETRRIVARAIGQLWSGNTRVDWRMVGADPRVSGSFDRMRAAYQRAIRTLALRLSNASPR